MIEQLQRLGHEGVILAGEIGPMAEFAASRGHRVTTEISSLDGWADSALVLDSILSYGLAERLPEVPQVFQASSALYDLSLPPGLPRLVSQVVVCSDRVEKRIRAMARTYELHRFRQPIDTERFKPVRSSPDRPRRALLHGNYLRGDRLELLQGVLDDLGIDPRRAGATSQFTLSPEQQICTTTPGRTRRSSVRCSAPQPQPQDLTGAPLRELSHLAQVRWLTEMRAHSFEESSRRAHEQLDGLEAELDRAKGLLGTRRVKLGLGAGRTLDRLRRGLSPR